ncbi:MAG: hypothetical protein BA861_11140 [Desulfobacterales bacterium S3730MH5]|nr:MAG: hypothetical protein BA861_11140 [Desulfobacterales bacterium S3730MH5]OEU84313.1 MAG: hypothetical protein BA865_08900 [Desulfobacterales bacterium S5133MH4]
MTEYQVLLKTQKNELFRIIEEVGLDASNFDWIEERIEEPERDHVISKLAYRGSAYFYGFDVTFARYLCRKCPGLQQPTGLAKFSGWSSVVANFTQWAKRVKKEIDTPDLWAEAQKYQSIFSLPVQDQTDRIPFSHTESEQIASALEEVERRIIDEFAPRADKIQFIQSKRSYLDSRAKRGYPRVDWMNLLMATTISIAASLSLSREQAHQLLRFQKEALAPVIHVFG